MEMEEEGKEPLRSGLDAYSSCTLESIERCLTCYRHLFSEEEVEVMSGLQSSDIRSVRFVSRMVLRKSQWVRSASVAAYFNGWNEVFNGNVTDEISKLEARGCVLVLGRSQMPLARLWEALILAFTKDEWRMLATELKLKVRSSDRCDTHLEMDVQLVMCLTIEWKISRIASKLP
jgi:hypothetical protein